MPRYKYATQARRNRQLLLARYAGALQGEGAPRGAPLAASVGKEARRRPEEKLFRGQANFSPK